ncbi:MAG: NAD-dependent dihydropyrimidine dehydrogenase subunit PreA [Selenomonadaceae bacterium]|nr:NAD-dependent dihydropyrimidine dehydrogenase subunit PreA [Selenomonadaceae bacterium]
MKDQIIRKEAVSCLLCDEAKCTKACVKKLPVSDIIRSIRFDNMATASKMLGEQSPCDGCSGPCVEQCLAGKIDRPIRIPEILNSIKYDATPTADIDLSIDFCGVKCENPFFLSSSVVGSNYEMIAKAFRAGWAGVAYKTISFLDIQEASPRFAALTKEDNPFIGFKNIEQLSEHTPIENFEIIRQLKRDFPTKVVMASIMGKNAEEWEILARMAEEAGADLVELNFSCPQMTGENLGSDIGINIELVDCYTAAARRGTKLPIIAKMTPNITHMAIPARASINAGANGIAAINTIKSIMNINLDTFVGEPNVSGKCIVSGYSGKAVKPIALRFISDMRADEMLKTTPISGIGGIETWRDAAEYIAMGCENIQVTTAIMQYGYRIVEDMITGLQNYLSEHGMKSVNELVGKANGNITVADNLDRNTVEYPKFNRNNCIGCGRCAISCYDGGHQALRLDDKLGKPVMDPKKCVGCQLCRLVCPVGAIEIGTRVEKK